MVGMHLLEALPVAMFATDESGRLTFCNEAAVALWGGRPASGCPVPGDTWQLFWPDGRMLRPEEWPMALALQEGRAVSAEEVVARRPDDTRVALMAYASPLRDGARSAGGDGTGPVTGSVNLLAEMGQGGQDELAAARLAAIVASSDDAIVGKTLDGIVTSWNAGATRIFGYEGAEMIGRSIRQIIPAELQGEEEEILARLRAGERIDHFDTVRIAKDGRRVHISLSVSPIRDGRGTIVGASKVARDVTERKRGEEMQALLFNELDHRVRNMLATIKAIASQSARGASGLDAFVAAFNGRVQALARVHDRLGESGVQGADLEALIQDQLPAGEAGGPRVACSGPGVMLEARVAVQLTLVLHELATNTRRHGALAVPGGRLTITWSIVQDGDRELRLSWRESGVQGLAAPTRRGFGSSLIESGLAAVGGTVRLDFGDDGVACEMRLPLPTAGMPAGSEAPPQALRTPVADPWPERPTAASVRKGRVLVVEDEPLVAMLMEDELEAAGHEVLGPAPNTERALRLIADEDCDAALVDANLNGHAVDGIVAALAARGIPFAFATGYGRDALPQFFRDAPLLAKPFSHERLLAVVGELLERGTGPDSGSTPPARRRPLSP